MRSAKSRFLAVAFLDSDVVSQGVLKHRGTVLKTLGRFPARFQDASKLTQDPPHALQDASQVTQDTPNVLGEVEIFGSVFSLVLSTQKH